MERHRRDSRQSPPVDWRTADSEVSDSDDEWWSDESSCSTCSSASYDDDDRWSVASEAIAGGELFYVECKAQNLLLAQKMKKKLHHSGADSSSKPRSWKKGAHGTLLRLMKRGRKKVVKNKKDEEPSAKESTSHRKLSVSSLEQNSGEIIEIRLIVESRRHNLGRRATPIEIMLGIVPGNFSMAGDDDRIMVAGFIPDMPASLSKKMKIGDWLQSIDGQQVNHSNLDNVLIKIPSSSTVTIRLRRVEESSNIHAAPYLLAKGLEIDHLLQIMCKGAASSYKGFLLLLDKDDKVLYNYPAGGPLLDARALFLTLTQFFDDMFGSQPRSTNIVFDSVPYLVMYFSDDNHIMLLAVPTERSRELELKEFFEKFVESIQFSYHSFLRAACDYKSRLDLLVDSLFCQLDKNEQQLHFHTHAVSLPNKIQNEVDSALYQLEAAPSNMRSSSGMYYILGSCLFYKTVCVRSHLPEGVLDPVTAFLWIHNVLSLEQAGLPLHRLLVWKQVYLPEQPEQPDAFIEPPGKHYLLLLGQNQFMIVVLIKSDINPDADSEMMKPSVSYIEHVQDTLDNLQLMGLSSVLDALIEDKGDGDRASTSDQHSISSDQSFFHRANSVEGTKRFSPKRQHSRLSVNSEGETFSETSSEASWNSSELSSYGRFSRYRTPSKFALESVMQGVQALMLNSGNGTVVLASAALKDSLSPQLDGIRLKILHLMGLKGVVEGVGEVGIILVNKGKKNNDCCIVAGKKMLYESSNMRKIALVCSEDIGINLHELASRLAITFL